MGVDNPQDHQLLFKHCVFTCFFYIIGFSFFYLSERIYCVSIEELSAALCLQTIFEFVKLTIFTVQLNKNSAERSVHHIPKSSYTISQIIEKLAKCIILHVVITVLYYVVIVLFGAPLLSLQKETFFLAVTLTALTVTPSVIHLGIENSLQLFKGKVLFDSGSKGLAGVTEINVKSVLIFTWLGAFVIPLDWERQWQQWPIPCVLGAMFGLGFGNLFNLKNFAQSPIRKIKKGDTVKSC